MKSVVSSTVVFGMVVLSGVLSAVAEAPEEKSDTSNTNVVIYDSSAANSEASQGTSAEDKTARGMLVRPSDSSNSGANASRSSEKPAWIYE